MAADHVRARVHVEFVGQLELVGIVPAAGPVVADIERCLVAVERSMGSALVGIVNSETLAVADVAAVDIARCLAAVEIARYLAADIARSRPGRNVSTTTKYRLNE